MLSALRPALLIRPVPVLLLCVLSPGALYLGLGHVATPHDKLLHFATFLVFTACFFWSFRVRSVRTVALLTLVVCTAGAGVGLEVLQLWAAPWRVFDWRDVACNVAGSALALAVSVAVRFSSSP